MTIITLNFKMETIKRQKERIERGYREIEGPISPFFFLFFHSNVHIKRGTSAKNFFNLNKTRIFYDFFNPTFVWYIPSADRESTGSSMTSCDVVSGTLVALAPVITINERGC